MLGNPRPRCHDVAGAVVRFGNSEVEPDQLVRLPAPRKKTAWNRMPKPILIVEVLSEYARRRDMVQANALH
jgi:Uma2 family endonuclease